MAGANLSNLPVTSTETVHGLVITDNATGTQIGGVNDFSTSMSLTLSPTFEFGPGTTVHPDDIPAASGEPYELVPQNIGGCNITFNRYNLYSKRFVDLFGTPNIDMITQLGRPLTLVEYIKAPLDASFDWRAVYYGCRIASMGETKRKEGDVRVMVNAQLSYTRRRRLI